MYTHGRSPFILCHDLIIAYIAPNLISESSWSFGFKQNVFLIFINISSTRLVEGIGITVSDQSFSNRYRRYRTNFFPIFKSLTILFSLQKKKQNKHKRGEKYVKKWEFHQFNAQKLYRFAFVKFKIWKWCQIKNMK